MKGEEFVDFLRDYVKELQAEQLPERNFPLHTEADTSSGCVTIKTAGGRHVATVDLDDDGCLMPLDPSTFAYAELFVRLANEEYSNKEESDEKAD